MEDASEEEVKEEGATEYWKARFELDEIPEYNPAFTTEEHIRILHLRAQDLEKTVRRLDSTNYCLISILIIFGLVAVGIAFL